MPLLSSMGFRMSEFFLFLFFKSLPSLCLSQKERDLELAARIGQSLLKKNKTLTERNELLEEQVEHIREEVRSRRGGATGAVQGDGQGGSHLERPARARPSPEPRAACSRVATWTQNAACLQLLFTVSPAHSGASSPIW